MGKIYSCTDAYEGLLEDSDNLPAPEVIAQEMIEDLEGALEQLRAIAADVGTKS